MTTFEKGRYQVKTLEYTFELDIFKTDNEYRVEFGDLDNEEGACIYFKYDPTTTFIKLESLQHQSTCATNTELGRGNGTKTMIKFALSTCLKIFPNAKRIVFNDAASIDCHGKNMNLCYKYVLVHGISWYEHFGAILVNKSSRQLLANFKEMLEQKPRTGIFSFFKTQQQHENNITYQTWHDYFRSIGDCNFFIANKHEFEHVAKVSLFFAEWYIRASTIRKYELASFEIQRKKKQPKMQFGGGNGKGCYKCRQAHMV
jgi:hypothetical protein